MTQEPLSQEGSTSSPLSPMQGRRLTPGLLQMERSDCSPRQLPSDGRLRSDTLAVLPQSESKAVQPPYLQAPYLLTLLISETFGLPDPQRDTPGALVDTTAWLRVWSLGPASLSEGTPGPSVPSSPQPIHGQDF